MSKRLYVGGLPWATTQDELKAEFGKAGAVEDAVIVTDKMTGRSRGFGFVTMTDDADGDKAVEMFNGKDFGGRKLTVNEARPMTERAPRRDFNRGGDYSRSGQDNWS